MSENKRSSQIFEEKNGNKEVFKDFLSPKSKELRKERGYPQRELAERLGVPVSTYANWEQGRREPCIFDLYNLIWTLNVEPNELFATEELY